MHERSFEIIASFGNILLEAAVRCGLFQGPLCGQTGLLLALLLLTQHPVAGAARFMLHSSQGRQTGHSTRLDDVNSKLHFRCVVHELEGRGQTGLVQMRLLLTQHPSAVATTAKLEKLRRLRTGHSITLISRRTAPH
jgi:hypothetical protein